MITTTIRLNEAVRDTAKEQAKKYRGGLSGYIDTLICADLKKNGVDVKAKEKSK